MLLDHLSTDSLRARDCFNNLLAFDIIALDKHSSNPIAVINTETSRSGMTSESIQLVLSVAAAVLIPVIVFALDRIFAESSSTIAVAWVLVFSVNVITVSLPGRFDNSKVTTEGGPWKSLFAPAPWVSVRIVVLLYLKLEYCLFKGICNLGCNLSHGIAVIAHCFVPIPCLE